MIIIVVYNHAEVLPSLTVLVQSLRPCFWAAAEHEIKTFVKNLRGRGEGGET